MQKTKLEEFVKAWKQDEDLGPLLAHLYNHAKEFGIERVQEGSLRAKYNMSGTPLYANKYFRVISSEQGSGLYEFLRDGGDMVTSIWISESEEEKNAKTTMGGWSG